MKKLLFILLIGITTLISCSKDDVQQKEFDEIIKCMGCKDVERTNGGIDIKVK